MGEREGKGECKGNKKINRSKLKGMVMVCHLLYVLTTPL